MKNIDLLKFSIYSSILVLDFVFWTAEQGLKTIRKIFVVVGFSIIPFFIIFAFAISLIR